MVSVVTSSVVHRRFKTLLGQTKDYKIGICCYSVKHTALRRNSKDWLVRNHNNVSEWSEMSTRIYSVMCGMALCALNVCKSQAYPGTLRYNTKMMLFEY